MYCNILKDNRINFKTALPYRVGSFWLDKGSEEAKLFVRAITRLNTQSNLWKATDYLQNLLGNSSPLINGLDFSIKIDWKKVETANFDKNNYLNTTGNGFKKESTIPLRKVDLSQAGVYGLQSETFAAWTDIYGIKWLFPIEFNPESINPFGQGFEIYEGPAIILQPKQVIKIEDKYPTVILTKNSYQIYGLDFDIENGNLNFYESMETNFEERIQVVSCYTTKESLMAFAFSVDKNVINTDHIAAFLRVANSINNLEKALCQVAGYTSIEKDIYIKKSEIIPGGTFIVTHENEAITLSQYEQAEGFYSEGTFIGSPVKLITGAEAFSYVKINGLPLPAYPKSINLKEEAYFCQKIDDFVHIDYGQDGLTEYLNSTREFYESVTRLDIDGNLAKTFSEYLISKYPSLEVNPVMIDIVREFFNLYEENIIVIKISNKLNQQQKNAVIDFLQTHSLTNAIIIYNENAYYTDI
jgi:hypothetical protein